VIYEAGQQVDLRTQVVDRVDKGRNRVYYPHIEGQLLSGEGSETVTLAKHEADALNEGKHFSRELKEKRRGPNS